MLNYIKTNESKLKSFWTSIGGDYTALKKSIEVGYNKKAIGSTFGVGVAPQALAATATPIIIKVSNLLKSAGIDVKDIAKFAGDKIKQVAQNKIAEVVEKAAEKIESAVTPKEKEEALKLHLKSVSDHINKLADKNYHALAGLKTPEYIFLFMPIEGAMTLALNQQPQLFETALKKQIVLIISTQIL